MVALDLTVLLFPTPAREQLRRSRHSRTFLVESGVGELWAEMQAGRTEGMQRFFSDPAGNHILMGKGTLPKPTPSSSDAVSNLEVPHGHPHPHLTQSRALNSYSFTGLHTCMQGLGPEAGLAAGQGQKGPRAESLCRP